MLVTKPQTLMPDRLLEENSHLILVGHSPNYYQPASFIHCNYTASKEISIVMKLYLWRPLILVIVASFTLTTAIKLRAQSQETASLTGTVTDASGAVVSGASIELTNPATGKVYK